MRWLWSAAHDGGRQAVSWYLATATVQHGFCRKRGSACSGGLRPACVGLERHRYAGPTDGIEVAAASFIADADG